MLHAAGLWQLIALTAPTALRLKRAARVDAAECAGGLRWPHQPCFSIPTGIGLKSANLF